MRKYDAKLLDELKDKKLLFVSGLPGTGKSYFARKLARWYGALYLASDTIRSSMYETESDSEYMQGTQMYIDSLDTVYMQLQRRLMQKLRTGRMVVVDSTLMVPQRTQLLSVLDQQGYLENVAVVLVKSDDEMINHRIQMRKRQAVDPEGFEQEWRDAYDWFLSGLDEGRLSYPSESEGVSVIEVWNE